MVTGSCFGLPPIFTWYVSVVAGPTSYNMILIAWQFSLFIFDFIHAIGGVLNIRWAGDGQVATGSYCVAQGIIKQIGALGTALTTIVSLSPRCHHVSEPYRHTPCQILAVHTFIAALWRIGIEARGFAFGLVGLTCVFITLSAMDTQEV